MFVLCVLIMGVHFPSQRAVPPLPLYPFRRQRRARAVSRSTSNSTDESWGRRSAPPNTMTLKVCDGMRRDGMGWDGMRWDERDEMGGGMGSDVMWWHAMGWNVMWCVVVCGGDVQAVACAWTGTRLWRV
jgi:hypothetical protein